MAFSPFVFPNDPQTPWSIMIVLYPYMTGLVAGTFLVSALHYVFGRDVLKPVARLALVTSLCFCTFATLPLLLHLRHPERAFNVMITPNAGSAMAAFGFVYSACMLLLSAQVWLVFRPALVRRADSRAALSGLLYRVLLLGAREITEGAQAADAWAIRVLAIAGIPVACALSGYVGFLFAAIKGNPWWSTALLPAIFLVSAVASGVAALVAIYVFLGWLRGVAPDADCLAALSRYLWIALVVAASLELFALGHMVYERGEEWHVLSTLVREHLAVSYGVVQLLIGSALPFFLLPAVFLPKIHPRRMTLLAGLAAMLVLVQVLAMRWNIVVGGQLFSKSFRGFVEYNVPWFGREGLIAAGIIFALPLLALWAAEKILPLWQGDER